jgi:capsular polysaccharide biosynthesis protein
MRPNVLRTVGTFSIGLGLLLGIAVASYALFTPRIYESTVSVLVDSPNEDEVFPDAHYWTQTTFERIQSKSILYQVITNLNLQTLWAARSGQSEPLSSDETYPMLKRRMIVSQKINSSLIEIAVCSEDRFEAANIANEVARIYSYDRRARKRPVQIINVAQPGLRPVAPKRVLIIVGFLTSILLIAGGGVVRARFPDGRLALS